MIKAPWTDEQVADLNYYQDSGVFHPYTCGNDECRHKFRDNLIATNAGWICPHCDYTQDTANVFSREMIDAQLAWRRELFGS